MKKRLIKILGPKIAAVAATLIVTYVPRLQGHEEMIIGWIMTGYLLVEAALAKGQAERQELVAQDQRVLKAEGLYDGKIDGKYGPKTSTAIHGGRPV